MEKGRREGRAIEGYREGDKISKHSIGMYRNISVKLINLYN
jgi:hypothetical protein